MSATGQGATLTAWNDPAVDAHVERLLSLVVEAVTRRLGPALRAIVLAGGFGRGEGGVLRRPDGSLHIVNDFDIELVYREPLGRLPSKLWVQLRHRRAVQALAERLAREFGMKQVDLTLRGEGSLGRHACRLADYDLQHGRRLLWGRADPCERMPPLAASDISPFEATWLLRNRGIGLLLARLYLDRGGLSEGERENFYIEINKAWLAMGDALWILSGRYTVRYADRAAAFDRLREQGWPEFDALAAGYGRACEYKLRPVRRPYPDRDPEDLWEPLARLYGRFFLWLEGRRLGREFGGLPDYARWMDTQPRSGGSAVRRWLDRRLGITGDCPDSLRPLKHDALGSVLIVMALLAARLGDKGAQALLERWAVPGDAANAWTARARGLLALMHPGGEVGRFLAQAQARPAASTAIGGAG